MPPGVAQSTHVAPHAQPGDAGPRPTRRRRPGGMGSAARDAGSTTRRVVRSRAGRSAARHAVRGHLAELHALADNRGVTDVDGDRPNWSSLVDGGARDDDATPHPVGVDPDPRPRAAVGSAGQRAAVLGARVRNSNLSHAGVDRDDRPGGAVGLPGRRPAGGARPARGGVPHLPVRVRDGTGLVGPLVIPGVTSCLGAPTYTAATGTPAGRPSPRSCATPSAAPTGPRCWPPPRWH